MSGRISERQRYWSPRSQPVGPILARPARKVRFGKHMMPRSWPTEFWFRSKLFERGRVNRKARFTALIERGTRP